MTEKQIYQELYRRQKEGISHPKYGNGFHGQAFVPEFIKMNNSVLDIGCGHNQFVKALREAGVSAWGIDFACPGADSQADVLEGLSFKDKSFDWVTAFDVLEHLLPETVDQALTEMARVSRSFCFTIAFRPSGIKVDGRNLHPTVRTKDWWFAKLVEFAAVTDIAGNSFKGVWK